MNRSLKISVVVVCEPIDDKCKLILPDFCQQTLPWKDFEVVFADGTGDERHKAIVEQMTQSSGGQGQFRHLKVESINRSLGRNRGIEATSAPLILLMAEDFQVFPRTVEAHLRFHEENPGREIVGVGASFFTEEYLRNPFTRWLDETGTLFGVPFHKGEIPSHFFYGGNTSIKKEFLLSVGPSDERFPYHAWDDYELGLRLVRAGMQSRLVPGAEVAHVHRVGLEDRGHQIREGGASAAIFDRNLPGTSQPWHPLVRTPLWMLEARKGWAAGWAGLVPTEKNRDRFYRAYLDREFACAYQKEIRA